VTRRLEKKDLPNFSKNSPKNCRVKKGQNKKTKLNLKTQTIYIKPLKLKILKYLNKTCFETAYLGKNLINLLKQKVAIILGYFIRLPTPSFQKITMSLQN
jgi:hypothetical protein